MKRFFIALTLLAAITLGLPAMAAEPSLHEVYQSANAGRLDEAHTMMREVLAAHPNSGKAHYVNAELLARQGQLKQADAELATAEKLAPGLPFASAESVSELKRTLQQPARAHALQPAASALPSAPAGGFPWGMLAAGLGVIAFIAWAARLMTQRNAANTGNGTLARAGFGNSAPYAAPAQTPYGAATPPAYGGPAAAPMGGSGLGSQVLGGLATGVAVGAGVAAGEALMHRVLDGHKSSSGFSDLGPSTLDRDSTLPDAGFSDLGGDDFGIADNSSWDDGGSSSDSDWN